MKKQLLLTCASLLAMGTAEAVRPDIAEAGKGPKMRVWLQDPSQKTGTATGTADVVLPTKIQTTTSIFKRTVKAVNGPVDSEIRIMTPAVAPTSGVDFIYQPGTRQFDVVHTFATVRNTLNLQRSDMTWLQNKQPQNDALNRTVALWDAKRPLLDIYPFAGNDANAYYNREVRGGKVVTELKFFSFAGGGQVVHTCRSSDVVRHEVGHAMLDRLHPEYFDTWDTQVGALHEAYGDITSLFGAVEDDATLRFALSQTKGNLHKKNILAVVGEQFGQALGSNDGIRNVDQNYTLSTAGDEVHDLSRVMSGAVYDIFTKGYQEADDVSNQELFTLAEGAGRYLRRAFLSAVINEPSPTPTFSNIAYQLHSVTETLIDDLPGAINWASFVEDEFKNRGVSLNPTVKAKKIPSKVEKRHICGTSLNCSINHESE